MCGMPIFSTAEVPSAIITLATHAQLTSGPSNGLPSVSDHRCSSSCTTAGSRPSQSIRSDVLRQFSASFFEMPNPVTLVTLSVRFQAVNISYGYEQSERSRKEPLQE